MSAASCAPFPTRQGAAGGRRRHACLGARVWRGEAHGYIELDPTNDIIAGGDHIVVGYGCDYADVAPVIGVLKSYGNQKITQAVDVVPVS